MASKHYEQYCDAQHRKRETSRTRTHASFHAVSSTGLLCGRRRAWLRGMSAGTMLRRA